MHIPIHVVSEIMGYLPRKDLQHAMMVSKTWYGAYLGCRSFWNTPSLVNTTPEILEDVVGVMSTSVPGDWLTLESPRPGTAPRIIEACGPKYGSLTCFSLYDHPKIIEALYGHCRHLLRLGLWLRPGTDISSLVHMTCLEELDIMFLGSGAVISMYDFPSEALQYLHLMGVEQVVSWKRFESLKHLTLETTSQMIDLDNLPNLETLDVMARHLYLYGGPSPTLHELVLDVKFVHFEDGDDRVDRQFPGLKKYRARGWHCPKRLPPTLQSIYLNARDYYIAGIVDWSGSKLLSSVTIDRLSCDTLMLPASVQRLVLSDVSGELQMSRL